MRIRTIKPDFWTDSKITRLPYDIRLFFIGLWNVADNMGYIDYKPDQIKRKIFPDEKDSSFDPFSAMDILEAAGLIMRFLNKSGGTYFRVTNFLEHQYISESTKKSRIPDLSDKNVSVHNHFRLNLITKLNIKATKPVKLGCRSCSSQCELSLNSFLKEGMVTVKNGLFYRIKGVDESSDKLSYKLIVICNLCNERINFYDTNGLCSSDVDLVFSKKSEKSLNNLDKSGKSLQDMEMDMDKEMEVELEGSIINSTNNNSRKKDLELIKEGYNVNASKKGWDEMDRWGKKRKDALNDRLKEDKGFIQRLNEAISVADEKWMREGFSDRPDLRASIDYFLKSGKVDRILEQNFAKTKQAKKKEELSSRRKEIIEEFQKKMNRDPSAEELENIMKKRKCI
jgi:hypothetical protein